MAETSRENALFRRSLDFNNRTAWREVNYTESQLILLDGTRRRLTQ